MGFQQNHRYRQVFAVAVCAALPGCHSSRLEETPRDGVFVHVSSGPEQPHRVLMALNMAALMAEKQDRDVLMYFDIEGIKVLLKDAPDLSMQPFPSSRTNLEKLLESKVPITACPGCLKALGKTPGDLMPGVQVASKDAFFNFTKGRILTLDY